MNEKESMMHKATRKALDVMIRRTYDGWPPFSPWYSSPSVGTTVPSAAGAFLFYGLCVLRPYMQMEKQCTQKINILM